MAGWVSTPTLLAGADHRPNIHDHDLDDDGDDFPAETFILMRKKMGRRGIMVMRMKEANAAALFIFRQHFFACSHFLLPPATFLQDFPSQRQELPPWQHFFPGQELGATSQGQELATQARAAQTEKLPNTFCKHLHSPRPPELLAQPRSPFCPPVEIQI